MNNLTITNNYKDSIIVANLQEKAKYYARHAFTKNTIKVIGKISVFGVSLLI